MSTPETTSGRRVEASTSWHHKRTKEDASASWQHKGHMLSPKCPRVTPRPSPYPRALSWVYPEFPHWVHAGCPPSAPPPPPERVSLGLPGGRQWLGAGCTSAQGAPWLPSQCPQFPTLPFPFPPAPGVSLGRLWGVPGGRRWLGAGLRRPRVRHRSPRRPLSGLRSAGSVSHLYLDCTKEGEASLPRASAGY